MAITEEDRYEVYQAFRASHGDKVANGLIEMLPPVGWADVATKHDLAGLEERMELRFQLVDQTLRLELTSLRHEFGEQLERELRRQSTKFVAWLFAGVSLFSVLSGVVERLI